MDAQNQEFGELQRVAELVKEIRFAMLTTEHEDGALHSRPMATIEMDQEGNLWFFTALSSAKSDEAQRHRQVNLAYTRPDKQDYLSISGFAEFVRDEERMKRLWTPWIKPWFPQGLADPDLILLKITVSEAQYWDAPGNAFKRLYGLSKAILTGNKDALGENRQMRM